MMKTISGCSSVLMSKLLLFPVLFAAAMLWAGFYGALHDQISYTVGPEYFHSYKFEQFQVPERLQNRLGASIVGWQASWWMGYFIGLPVLLLALLLPTAKAYFAASIQAFAVVTGTVILLGLIGLVYATMTGEPPFDRVGIIHDFSYVGGYLGIATGSTFILFKWARSRRTTESASMKNSDIVAA